jgi:hypothetical protein
MAEFDRKMRHLINVPKEKIDKETSQPKEARLIQLHIQFLEQSERIKRLHLKAVTHVGDFDLVGD